MLASLSNGPFGSFDFHSDLVVVVDEAKNQLVTSDLKGTNIRRYTIPAKFFNQRYYWLKLHFINANTVIGLLKCHVVTSFHIVSLRLDHHTISCVAIQHIKTGILSHGFRVESHRAGSQIVYSICNSRNYKCKVAAAAERDSDRKRFLRQLRAATFGTTYTDTIARPPPYDVPMRMEESEPSSPTRQIPDRVDQTFIESVLLLVRYDNSGSIYPHIISTGRRRYGIKVRRTNSVKTFNRTFSNKFMTRWTKPPTADLCEPFLWGNNAVLICRNNASHIFLSGTIVNPRSGFLASILNKLRHGLRMHTPMTNPVRVEVRGVAPDPTHIWSNVELIAGDPTLLTVDPVDRTAALFSLCRPNEMSYEWNHREVHLDEIPENLVKLAYRCNPQNQQMLIVRCADEEETVLRNSRSHFKTLLMP
ncbi:unnamed protein product [Caenorhabditis auriculariae]|uniref:Uncharacterized protein n=1 Tax=Caenorhabditis auriculariae TaxID=2777116 RepID=A0A8S1GYY5_9PELO|nr:unnamed protein product [Caenorhabditis auriculariae]